MSTTEKILLIVLGVLILAYIFVYFYGTSPIHNDGSVEVNGKINNSYPAQNLSSIPYNSGESDVNGNIAMNNNGSQQMILNNMTQAEADQIQMINNEQISAVKGEYLPNNDYAPPESQNGYVNSSFAKGVRGNYRGSEEIDNYFDQNNNVIYNAFMDKPIVTGIDETNGQYGTFVPTKTQCSSYNNQDCDPNDLYNADNYLPQQKIPSWFEPGPDPISVKDRNEVNISRTLAINTTLANSNKNQSWDIRGGINNPRGLVGPWNQSVIEPGDDHHRLY